MKTKLLVFAMFWVGFTSFSQNTYVPDDNFEQALINWGFDSLPLDDYVPTANINTVTYLDVSFYFIDDLTGIEDFTALSTLNCSSNNLNTLNVSNNNNLTELYCYDNLLGSLDVSNNSLLTSLNCYANQLTSLDVSNNYNLTHLDCNTNDLSSLELFNNTVLENLNCSYNNLTSLDLSSLTTLTFLSCVSNSITNLELGGFTTLTTIYCSWNDMSNLNASNNAALTYLYCDNNNLVSLDLGNNVNQLNCRSNNLYSLNLSTNTSLVYLTCQNNDLHYLDVQNGNNTNVTLFQAHDNPDLDCINVDDAAYSTANWSTHLDPASSFSENCPALGVEELEASEFNIYPNPVSDILSVESKLPLKKIEIYSILGQRVKEINSDFNSISTNNLSRGIFMIKIYSEKGIAVRKLIKQ